MMDEKEDFYFSKRQFIAS